MSDRLRFRNLQRCGVGDSWGVGGFGACSHLLVFSSHPLIKSFFCSLFNVIFKPFPSIMQNKFSKHFRTPRYCQLSWILWRRFDWQVFGQCFTSVRRRTLYTKNIKVTAGAPLSQPPAPLRELTRPKILLPDNMPNFTSKVGPCHAWCSLGICGYIWKVLWTIRKHHEGTRRLHVYLTNGQTNTHTYKVKT